LDRPALRPAAAQLIYNEFWIGKAGYCARSR
jgi:hypothetical protein